MDYPTFKQINTLLANVRRNHGIEHATVGILTQRKIKPPIFALATPSGFMIYSKLNKNEILSATNESIKLMLAGDSELAISQYCGTNIVAGGIIAVISTIIFAKILGKKSKGILNIANGFFISTLLSKPIGRLVQKYITTDQHINGIKVKNIRSLNLGNFYIHHISTIYNELDSD